MLNLLECFIFFCNGHSWVHFNNTEILRILHQTSETHLKGVKCQKLIVIKVIVQCIKVQKFKTLYKKCTELSALTAGSWSKLKKNQNVYEKPLTTPLRYFFSDVRNFPNF